MTNRLIILFLLLTSQAFGQQEGIVFEEGTSWAAVKAKAKSQHKYIFMDCVTTWCVPCKEMSRNVFPTKEAGAFFNANFINVKVQMDQTELDDELTTAWYEDAKYLANEHEVVAFPTFLFFDPDGELVHRIVGARDLYTFIAQSAEALIPEKQYHTRVRAFEQSDSKSVEDYRTLAIAARAVFDGRRANEYATRYLELASEPLKPAWIEFAHIFNTSSQDSLFSVFIEHSDSIDSIMGEGFAARHVVPIILREEVYPKVAPGVRPDWMELEARLTAKYPEYAATAVARFKALFYQRSADWDQFERAVGDYLNRFPNHVLATDLHQYALTFYEIGEAGKAIELLESAVVSGDENQKALYKDLLHQWK